MCSDIRIFASMALFLDDCKLLSKYSKYSHDNNAMVPRSLITVDISMKIHYMYF